MVGPLFLVACVEPVDWALPSPSPSARSVAIHLEAEAGPRVLWADHGEPPQAYAVLGRPTLLAFSPRNLSELGTPRLLAPTPRAACDRQRPLPIAGFEAYRGSPEDGWSPTSEVEAFEAFSLPPLELAECLRAGCVRRDETGVHYCAANCVAPEPPEAPERAACPAGWLEESSNSARCRPPVARGCATSICWLFAPEPGEVCDARAQPAGTERHQGSTLPPRIVRPLWLPRGRYTGDTEVQPGGALLGECHQGTTIEGKLILRDGARVSDLNLEVPNDAKGIEITGRGVLVERVRIRGAEYGVLLRPRSQAELRALYVEGGGWGLTAQSSELELLHFHAGPSLYEGLKLESSTGTIADLVINSDTDYFGLSVLRGPDEPSASPLRLERAYVEGRHQAQFLFAAEVIGRDLRADGQGAAGVGLQAAQMGTVLELDRVYFADLQEDGLWSRDDAEPRIRDLLVQRSGGGLLSSTALRVTRGWFEDQGSESIKVNASGEVELRDLTIVGARLGLRLTPDLDEPHLVQVSRALIEGGEVGVLRGPGQVALEEVQVKGTNVGVQTGACWIDESLSAMHFQGVLTPALVQEP